MRQTPLLAALLLFASPAVRAATVEASSTTFVTVGQDTRYRGGTKPELVTVAPAYEILSVTARDISAPFADDVQAVLSTWGAVDLAKRRWDAGTDSNFSGDVTTAYLQARMANRHLTLRLGRISVATGIARMIQVDGGSGFLELPVARLQLKVSGYAGVPTSQRFQTRSGLKNWNPTPGTLAYGGRVAAGLPLAGMPGRGLEVGASINEVRDHSEPVREEVGLDARLAPFAGTDLALSGFGSYSLYDARVSEASAALSASATPKLHLTADWRYVEPSLLLSRNSILSVFSASTWNEVGAGAVYDFTRAVRGGLDAHLRTEPGRTSGTHSGADLAGHVDFTSGRVDAGAELSYLDAVLNGYTGLRVYGRRDLARFFLTADVLAQFFRADVNGQSTAVTGTVSAGLPLTHGFTAVVSGSAGVTPYLEQNFQIMAKLAYNQTYKTQEVR